MAIEKNEFECEVCGEHATVHLMEIDRQSRQEISHHLCEKHASITPILDANQSAAHAIANTIAKHEKPLPADFEAAWVEWSRGIAKVDARGMALLRAAFEAGAEAAKRNG